MSYHLYQTEGIVLGSAPTGESNRYYFLFTKDLGLTIAFAQGVREIKSKLRSRLQDFSHIGVDLIRGRDTWRIVSVSEKNAFGKISLGQDKLTLLAKVAELLKRFLHGEEKNENLFNLLYEGFYFISRKELNSALLKDLEIILVAKILKALGYWGDNGETSSFLDAPISEKELSKVAPFRSELLKEINRALSESHL